MQHPIQAAIALALAVTVAPLPASAQWAAAVPLTTTPNNPTYSTGSESPCEYGMGSLKRISVAQIRQVTEGWRVWIRPICEDSPHAPVRNMGNATQLIGAIGRNPVLEGALEDKRYLADDVVGVELTKGRRAVLWVHPSLY
jgi:hypothetical protein